MSNYIQFETDNPDSPPVLIEVEEEEVTPGDGGLVKVGIMQDALQGAVAKAQKTFSAAIKTAIRQNVQVFIEAVNDLPEPPTEVEISFGLKATGEAGNVAIGKIGGEVNYTVKLAWKKTPNSGGGKP